MGNGKPMFPISSLYTLIVIAFCIFGKWCAYIYTENGRFMECHVMLWTWMGLDCEWIVCSHFPLFIQNMTFGQILHQRATFFMLLCLFRSPTISTLKVWSIETWGECVQKFLEVQRIKRNGENYYKTYSNINKMINNLFVWLRMYV